EVVDERSAGRGRRSKPFLRSVLLDGAEAGGHELSLLVPVEPPAAEGLFPRTEGPFARQVTATLADAVRAAHDGAEQARSSGSLEAFRLGAGLGLTAASCRALTTLAG